MRQRHQKHETTSSYLRKLSYVPRVFIINRGNSSVFFRSEYFNRIIKQNRWRYIFFQPPSSSPFILFEKLKWNRILFFRTMMKFPSQRKQKAAPRSRKHTQSQRANKSDKRKRLCLGIRRRKVSSL